MDALAPSHAEEISTVATVNAQTPMPAQVPHAASLTPRGNAVVAAYRLKRQIRDLSADDRAYLADLLAELVKEIRP